MVKIVGAGMAGLLAANMMRRRSPVIYEAQAGLPHNHSAVLRFRSPIVGEVLGVPFKKVRVLKCSLAWRNPVADAMAYSRKVIGSYRTDRSILPGAEVVERWIAPPDLIERMAEGIKIVYESPVSFPRVRDKTWEKVISTIPMPNLMLMLDYNPRPVFEYVRGTNILATLPRTEAYLSVHIPDPELPFSRISITGDKLIVECSHDVPEKLTGGQVSSYMDKTLRVLGMREEPQNVEVRRQTYAKISPIQEEVRRRFIFWASSQMGIAYQLGRYATWRPGLLLDDLVKDVRLIDNWIGAGQAVGYAMDIHNGRS